MGDVCQAKNMYYVIKKIAKYNASFFFFQACILIKIFQNLNALATIGGLHFDAFCNRVCLLLLNIICDMTMAHSI